MFNIYQPTFRSFFLAICVKQTRIHLLGFLHFQTKKQQLMSQGGEGHSPFWCPNVFLEPIFGASVSGAIARPNDWNTDSSLKAPVEAGGFKPCSHHPYMKKYDTINITSGKNWNIKLGQTNISLFAFEVMFEGIHNSVAPAVSLASQFQDNQI